MDTMLLVVTVVALTVAAVSTTVAWQVTQADRRRRAARIAALAAAAGVPDVPVVPEPSPLRSRLQVSDAPAVALPEGGVALTDRFLAADTSGSGSAGRQQWLLGGATLRRRRWSLSIGVVSLVNARRPAAADAAAPAPLELVALAHNRADGVLTVSGLVRNPAAGRAVDKLEAEVRVFDPAGILIATRTALVDYLELAPGQESPFVVAAGRGGHRRPLPRQLPHRRDDAAARRSAHQHAGVGRPHGGGPMRSIAMRTANWQFPIAAAAIALLLVGTGPAVQRPGRLQVQERRGAGERQRHGHRPHRPLRLGPHAGRLRRLRRQQAAGSHPLQRRARAGQPRHRARHERQHGRREDGIGQGGARPLPARAARRRKTTCS